MRVDLHNHTKLCNHATGEVEEYVKKAIELNIDVFGFSDHAPMNFDKQYRMNISQIDLYKNIVLNMQNKYKNKIEILFGYEVDFLPNFIENTILKADVDYLIGSVHFINKWGFDNPKFISEYKNKNIDQIWIDYFEAILQMAKSSYFDIVGHFDLIKVFKFMPKKDIKLLALPALKEIKKSNMILEINSAGFDKPIAEQYPSKELLTLAYELDINITFGSDAHSIKQVGRYYEQVIKIAKDIGYNKCVFFKNRDRQLVDF